MKRKSFYLGFALLFMILAFIIFTTRSGARGVHPFGNITPTAIPPQILTNISPSIVTSTQENANPFNSLPQSQPSPHPRFDLQKMYPVFPNLPNSEQILAQKLDGKPLGNGILRHIEPPAVLKGSEVGAYELSDLAWEEWTYDSFITVWPGYLSADPIQGILWVQITPHYKSYQDRLVIQSPNQAGKLNITGANRERLILSSEQGQIFYFDVPSLQFVNSLSEDVPPPTPNSETTRSSMKDAPDLPIDATDYQQVNVPLDSFINTPNDYDWFHFYSGVPGTINVSLIPRIGNYGLRVVLVDKNQSGAIVKEDVTPGNRRKQVVISDAPSGDYLVRVWSLDGSYSDNQPYTLLFDAPAPEQIIPILECVESNSDGTYTAHFGYKNPNSFVVVVDAKDHQNKFEPPPSFRTGQPEGFAPGRVGDWFSVLFDGNGLTWLLNGQAVTANRNSPGCQ